MGSEEAGGGWRAHGVTVRAGAQVLLDGVDAEVAPGELTVIMGPNGAGKSTLLKAWSGDVKLDAGRIEFGGRPLSAWAADDLARRRGILAQSADMPFPFSAEEVVLLGRSPHHGFTPTSFDREVAQQALEWVGGAELAGRPYPVLSGGERARVQLARVLAQVAVDPPAGGCGLLLDEPLAALDLGHQWEVMALLGRLARAGAAVGMVLHDLNLALQWAGRVILLDRGRCVAQGPPKETLVPEWVSAVWKLPMRRVVPEGGGAAWLVPAAQGEGPPGGRP